MAIKRNKPSWNKINPLAEFAYNGNSNLGGIYRIKNKTNDRQYIGSAARFKKRWTIHLSQLRKGTHCNNFLQNDFKKSGEVSYVFEIVEVMLGSSKEERKAKEQVYLDDLFLNVEKDKRYNIERKAVVTEPKLKTDRVYRNDWYWFLSPNGYEYVIENLSQFCEARGLNLSHMNRLSKSKIKQYKGWTVLNGSKNKTLMNKVTGECKDILCVRKFEEEHNLEHISALLAGRRKSSGDWFVKDRVIVPRNTKGKVVWVISPAGERIKVNNVGRFAIKHKLNVCSFRDFVNGKVLSHKGWLRDGTTQEDILAFKEKRYKNVVRTYEFCNPQGVVVSITNLSKFCRENKITSSRMLELKRGLIVSYRGWTMPLKPPFPSSLP